jgi:hypothetical protein
VSIPSEILDGRPDRKNQRNDADTAQELFQDVYPGLAGWVRRLVAGALRAGPSEGAGVAGPDTCRTGHTTALLVTQVRPVLAVK